MSNQGSILVLSSSNLDNSIQLRHYYPTANVSTIPGPNNTVVPNPFPQIPSVLPSTSYYTRLGNREQLVNLTHERDTLQTEYEAIVGTDPSADTTLIEGSIASLNSQIASLRQSVSIDPSYLANVANVTVKDFFQVEGPPPTEMTIQIDTRFLNLHVNSFNNDVKVFLSKYLLDCVWRDAEVPTGPSGTLTANAGTSTSERLRVYLYAGNPSSRESVRLLKVPIFRDGDGNNDPDFIIHRDQSHIYEKSHNPYHPNLNLSSDLYFENQYTQQSERFLEPGFFLGTIDPQAIRSLQNTREITIRWETDRSPEFPSPFWDAKFLRGSSLWNPVAQKFEVREPGSLSNVYFQRANTVSLAVDSSGNTMYGGPYFPLTLYTLEDPTNLSVAPFINDPNSQLTSVEDRLDGEICPLNDENVTLRLSQMAIANTADLGQVRTLNIPKMAPSDRDAFQVPMYNASSNNAEILTVYDRSSSTIPPRYVVPNASYLTNPTGNASIHFPNGEWRGQPLSSGNTSLGETWKSPFPWEQSLTPTQLSVLNETSAYETSANVQILNAHKYLFMDPGTTWNEHGGNVTIGERSLQFDFGTDRDFFINKFQLIFPKSQEDHQPYRLEASMQKAFKDTADQVREDVQSTYWMGGVQFSKLTGSQDSPEEYRYLNTHSQTSAGLNGSYTQLWDVGSRQVGSGFTAPSGNDNVQMATTGESRGRSNVVLPSSMASTGWYEDDPNKINPALDFQRQEFGPFTRGCTMAELKDTNKCKAWTGGSVAVTRPVETGNTFFFDLLNYMSSTAGSQELGYSVYVRASVEASVLSSSINSDWLSVTTSSTGDRFAAVERGNVYTYFDGTWTLRPAFTSSLTYSSISSSGSGDVLMASEEGGRILLSTNRGNTSTQLIATVGGAQVNQNQWEDVTLAVDGLTGLAVANVDFIYKYSAGGGILTSVPAMTFSEYVDIASSETGDVMAAIRPRRLYIKTGGTWTDRTPDTGGTNGSEVDDFNPWVAVTVSADGTRVAAVPDVGFILISNSPFTSWTRVDLTATGSARKTWQGIVFRGGYNMTGILWDGRLLTLTNGTWSGPTNPLETDWDDVVMASSANGQNMIAAVYGKSVWISENSGVNWNRQSVGVQENDVDWLCVAMSANGTHAAAAAEDGYLYLYRPNPSTNSNTWSRVDSAGIRWWNAVGVSQNGQYMYAAVYDGYIYGSSDSGETWIRDVSPGSYETWNGIVVRSSEGFAVTEDGSMFKLNIATPPSTSPTLVSKTSTPLAWRSVDSSNDGEIAVAVVYNGSVYTSGDSGESWTPRADPGVRPWIAVTLSENGKRRLVLSEDGVFAISSTTTKYAYAGLNIWTDISTTPPAPGHVWSSIDSSDDFSVLLATQTSIDGTSDTGDVYESGWDDATNSLKPWVVDTRVPTSDRSRWNSVAMTRDGKRAIAGAMSKTLFILDSGDIWYRLINSDSTSRTLATMIGPKARTNTATSLPPPTILNSEYTGTYASLFGEEFDEPVYDYVFDNHDLYLVDCTRVLLPTGNTAGQMLVEEPDGQLVFIDNEDASANIFTTQLPAYRVQGTLGPAVDYIVKESYYFAPKYDQYDTLGSTSFGGSVNVFDPRNSTRAQKVVNPSLGVGRYFGVAFGSFLYDGVSNNEVYTRGPGNAMKLYSFRPLTQLYSFSANCGVIQDRSGRATTLATFKNTVVNGMLENVQILDVGAKYVNKDLTRAYIHPTLDGAEEGVYYNSRTGTFADTPMFLLTGTTDEIVQTASNDDVMKPRHAQVTYDMVDDTTISEVLVAYTASDKTPLRRTAEFHLRVISST